MDDRAYIEHTKLLMIKCQQKEGVESGSVCVCVCVCVCVFCFPVDDVNIDLNANGDKSVEGGE